MAKIKNNRLKTILSYLVIMLAATLAAYSLDTFLIPNNILDGGVTGISIIVSKVFSIPMSLLVILINIPFVYVGYRNLGKNFLIRTIISMLTFSIALNFFESFHEVTDEILLATIFGGVLLGIGVGLVIRFGSCVDGTESVALVISKKTSLSVGQIVMLFNFLIYSVAALTFGIDRALYSVLTYFITFKVIDLVSEGLEQAKAALIVTEKGTDMANEIYKRLGRTVTKIKGSGLLSGEKEVMYCVLTRIEVFELKKIANEMDESAFITILDVSDIIGNHIKSTKRLKSKKSTTRIKEV